MGFSLTRREILGVMAAALVPRGLSGAPAASDNPPEPGKAGDIRVCLSDEPFDGAVAMTAASETTIREAGQKKVQHKAVAQSDFRIDRQAGMWSIGGKTLKGAALDLVPGTSPGLWVNNRLYRGRLRLVPFDNRRFWVVNTLPLEHYLCSVIDGEIPGEFHNEARKAQTVAARTYALRRRAQNASREFDIYASPVRDQNYHGFQYRDAKGKAFAGESPKSRQAVAETAGLVLRREGKLARTYYSACCGGVTSAGTTTFPDATEMVSVECGHCQECPRYRWTAVVTEAELSAAIRKAIGKAAPPKFDVAKAEVRGRDDRKHLPEIVIADPSGKTLSVDTRSFRTALGRTDLFSVWFSLEQEGQKYKVLGIGHGHGAGLCQWGANGFAKEGQKFDEILRHYYPGVTVDEFGS